MFVGPARFTVRLVITGMISVAIRIQGRMDWVLFISWLQGSRGDKFLRTDLEKGMILEAGWLGAVVGVFFLIMGPYLLLSVIIPMIYVGVRWLLAAIGVVKHVERGRRDPDQIGR